MPIAMIPREDNDWPANQILIPLKNYQGNDCIMCKQNRGTVSPSIIGVSSVYSTFRATSF